MYMYTTTTIHIPYDAIHYFVIAYTKQPIDYIFWQQSAYVQMGSLYNHAVICNRPQPYSKPRMWTNCQTY